MRPVAQHAIGRAIAGPRVDRGGAADRASERNGDHRVADATGSRPCRGRACAACPAEWPLKSAAVVVALFEQHDGVPLLGELLRRRPRRPRRCRRRRRRTRWSRRSRARSPRSRAPSSAAARRAPAASRSGSRRRCTSSGVVVVGDLERRRQHAHDGAARDVAGAPAFEQRQHLVRRQRRERTRGGAPSPRPRTRAASRDSPPHQTAARAPGSDASTFSTARVPPPAKKRPSGIDARAIASKEARSRAREQCRPRAFVTEPGSDLVEHNLTLPELVGPVN